MSVIQTRTAAETNEPRRNKRNFREAGLVVLYFSTILVATGGWLYFLYRAARTLVSWAIE